MPRERVPATRKTSGVDRSEHVLSKEGAGNAGCASAPVASCAMKKSTRAKSPQVHRHQPAFPARWFYGFLRALPGDRAFLPPSSLRSVSLLQELSASVGAPEPHDFAVRDRCVSSQPHQHVHRISRPTFVTIAKRPSLIGRETGQARKGDLPVGASEKIFGAGTGQPKSA
jgi:hypothetical protein